MRALLICAANRTITEIDYSGTTEEIQQHFGCRFLTLADDLPNGDEVWIAGDPYPEPPSHFFQVQGRRKKHPLRGLVLGGPRDDELTPAQSSLQDVQGWITFSEAMKAFLIDPGAREITEISFAGGLDAFYEVLRCNYITVAGQLPSGDDCWVDDEGLLRDPEFFFRMPGYPDPFAGRGLILSCNEEGESGPANSTLEELRGWIGFLQLIKVPRSVM